MTQEEVRSLLKASIKEVKKLNKAIRDGSWKPTSNVSIVKG